MPDIMMTPEFADAAASLPKNTRAKLAKTFKLLTSNPRHPSLQLKKIEGAVRKDVYECRLDQFWRIILKLADEMSLHLIYVGSHDDAIKHGVLIREEAAPYVEAIAIEDRLVAYLDGDDSVFNPILYSREQFDEMISA